jgi:phage gpG-like protein
VGGHIPYAAIHQFGGMAGRGKKVKIPARPYLAVSRGKEMEFAEKDRVRIMDIIREHLRG